MAEIPIQVTLEISRIFDKLGILHFVGGSLASSLMGEPRASQDVDFIADLREEHLDLLEAALGDKFVFQKEAAQKAIRHRSSFNILYLEHFFKIDIFVVKDDLFGQEELRRRKWLQISEESAQKVPFATTEDLVIAKLSWFKRGREVSDRQWRDILGVIKVQGDSLDRKY